MKKPLQDRLAIFDTATRRQALRNANAVNANQPEEKGRGWKREDLYDRRGLR